MILLLTAALVELILIETLCFECFKKVKLFISDSLLVFMVSISSNKDLFSPIILTRDKINGSIDLVLMNESANTNFTFVKF